MFSQISYFTRLREKKLCAAIIQNVAEVMVLLACFNVSSETQIL